MALAVKYRRWNCFNASPRDVFQNGVDEIESLLVWVFAGPSPEANWPHIRPQTPEPSAAESSGRPQIINLFGQELMRIGC